MHNVHCTCSKRRGRTALLPADSTRGRWIRILIINYRWIIFTDWLKQIWSLCRTSTKKWWTGWKHERAVRQKMGTTGLKSRDNDQVNLMMSQLTMKSLKSRLYHFSSLSSPVRNSQNICLIAVRDSQNEIGRSDPGEVTGWMLKLVFIVTWPTSIEANTN